MIGIDTNILTRYVLGDDPIQSPRVRKLLESELERGQVFFVCDLVLCEFIWVLERTYKISKEMIAQRLADLVHSHQFRFESREGVLLSAVQAYRENRGDFADYLILERSRAAGCSTILTFDKKLLKEPDFTSP
ncbi:type II toxin-antitoxin system VapC family toxin [bacterium]|nr:type II toxin-antitoxin system VapC family toxin [bacterium]